MQRFDSPFGPVALTDERKEHVLAFHPDVRRCLRYFATVLAKPELIIPSTHNSGVVICYGVLPKTRKYLAVVVRTGSKPFILTAYVAKRPKRL